MLHGLALTMIMAVNTSYGWAMSDVMLVVVATENEWEF